MKKKFLSFFLLFTLLFFINAEDLTTSTLHRREIYGQTFELIEYSDDTGCGLGLIMADNKTKTTKNYDADLPTIFIIYSNWFTNSKEYSDAVKACKDFFDITMNFVYLADMKDICDIAPCCEINRYSLDIDNNGEKNIFIGYYCSDLNLLFNIAALYNAKGREYVLEKYPFSIE